MRLQRNKKIRKVLNFYQVHFGLRPKYRVLVDSSFILHCDQCNFSLHSKLKDALGDQFKVFVSSCTLSVLTATSRSSLKPFSSVSCNHTPSLPCGECVTSLTSHKFFIATQDRDVLKTINSHPGIPSLSFHGPVIMVNEPSLTSKNVAQKSEDAKLTVDVPKEELDEPGQKKRKRRGPKQPNPLSCLPPKKKKNGEGQKSQGKARVRSRKVKEVTVNNG
ncbi:hypothetical protein P9112_013886 [Eukaryota sp. TZLM1-RC]